MSSWLDGLKNIIFSAAMVSLLLPTEKSALLQSWALNGWVGSGVRVLGPALRILEITNNGKYYGGGRMNYSWNFVPVYALELRRMITANLPT
jgi:hypothetical protein